MATTFHNELVTSGDTQNEWVRNVRNATVERVRFRHGKQTGTVKGFGKVEAVKLGAGKVWVLKS